MKAQLAVLTFIMFVLYLPLNAGGKGELQKYFNDASKKVKLTENASDKREILNKSFQNVSNALNMLSGSVLISKDESIGIDRFKAALQEKQDELAGLNGYERVSDEQLNSFSDYVVQDMEQADEMITISVVTLLLIVILVALLV
ncbi:MAG: hypothetical protein WAR79_10800 [Melioribacteraceae bacterium]